MSRSSFFKGCTPAGSGRAGRSGLKRRRSSVAKPSGSDKTAVHACISGIRKLARRAGAARALAFPPCRRRRSPPADPRSVLPRLPAGVMRIGKGVMDDPHGGALLAFRQFLAPILKKIVSLVEYRRRTTATANDVAWALKCHGM